MTCSPKASTVPAPGPAEESKENESEEDEEEEYDGVQKSKEDLSKYVNLEAEYSNFD